MTVALEKMDGASSCACLHRLKWYNLHHCSSSCDLKCLLGCNSTLPYACECVVVALLGLSTLPAPALKADASGRDR